MLDMVDSTMVIPIIRIIQSIDFNKIFLIDTKQTWLTGKNG